MTVSSRWMFLPALGGAMLLAACATDVPVPEDPQAQDWTPRIKSSYSSWQPPREMPEGNAEYAESFTAENAPQELVPMKDADDDIPGVILMPAETAAAEMVTVEILASTPDSCKLNQETVTDKNLKQFLSDYAKANKNAGALIVHLQGSTYAAKAGEWADFCKQSGFTSVKIECMEPSAGTKTEKSSVTKKAGTVRMVVDRDGLVKEYKVVKGDSLSRIAKKQYKNGNLWYIIFEANKKTLKSANKLVPGMKLQIPAVKPVGSSK